jgi:hypothetical protein
MATRYTEMTEQCFDDEYNRINVEYDANLDREEIYQYLDKQAVIFFDFVREFKNQPKPILRPSHFFGL